MACSRANFTLNYSLAWLRNVPKLWGVFLCAFAKLQNKRKLSLDMSVRPHETTRLPLDGFWWNLRFELLSQICWENSTFTKIRQKQRVLYMKTFSQFWQYLVEFSLKWEIFQIQLSIKSKHILCSVTFFPRNRAVYEIMSKNMVEPERLQTIWCMRFAC